MDEHKALLGIIAAGSFILGMALGWLMLLQIEVNHLAIIAGK